MDALKITRWPQPVEQKPTPAMNLEVATRALQRTNQNMKSNDDNSRRYLALKAPGTGLWVCETDVFRQWHHSPDSESLWIKGPAGTGKSVMAASIAEHLMKTEPGVPVLFFLHRAAHANSSGAPSALVRNWLAQLLPHSATLRDALALLARRNSNTIHDDVLWVRLLNGLSSLGKVVCIVDAIDEMESGEIDHLRRLVSSVTRMPAVKMLLTGQTPEKLQQLLGVSAAPPMIQLTGPPVSRDVRTFVAHQLQLTLPGPDKLVERERIVDEITMRSAGLFLCARLLVDQAISEITHGRKLPDMGQRLMPISLEDMYGDLLRRAADEVGCSADMQAFLLGCVTHCLRPLQLSELAGFYCLYGKSEESATEAKATVARACGPLLRVCDDETVQVLHHSVAEFILDCSRRSQSSACSSFPVIVSSQQHKTLAMLLMDLLKSQWAHVDEQLSLPCSPESDHPLRYYAEFFWAEHLGRLPDLQDSELFEATTFFCEHKNAFGFQIFRYWEWCVQPCCLTSPRNGDLGSAPLFLAGYAGMMAYAEHLLSSGHRLSAPTDKSLGKETLDKTRAKRKGQVADECPCFPLQMACARGHTKLVEFMLPRVGIPSLGGEKQSMMGDELVRLAGMYCRVGVLELLFKAGFEPISRRTKNGKPDLKKFAQYCALPVLTATLSYLDEETLRHLVCIYADIGDIDSLRAVLDRTNLGANAELDGKQALYFASVVRRRGEELGGTSYMPTEPARIDCVRLLLERGASASSQSADGRLATPLHGLVGSWEDRFHDTAVAVFDLLIQAGADLEAKDSQGETPLFRLFPKTRAHSKIEMALEHLLRAGASVDVKDASGMSLLHRALSYHRNPRIIELIVEKGVDVNAVVRYGPEGERELDVSPLGMLFLNPQRALREPKMRTKAIDFVAENEAITEILVRHGAHIDAAGSEDAFLAALPASNAETVRLLLASRQTKKPLGPILRRLRPEDDLYGIRSESNVPAGDKKLGEIISCLVQAGAPLEERDETGRTLLLASADDQELFEGLLDAGADRNAVDNEGNGVLHSFLSRELKRCHPAPPVARLQRLVQLGFDPHQLDSSGNTLLHVAVCFEQGGDEWPLFRTNGPLLEPMLRQLFDYGISPRSTNHRGLTPLHRFLEQQSTHWSRVDYPRKGDPTLPTFVEKLLGILEAAPGGIDINAVDEDGLTPLHICAMSMCHNSARNIEVLLEHGADIAAITTVGASALHLACGARNPSALRALLAHAAPSLLNQPDNLGRTPLFTACVSGVLESVGVLLDAGVAVDIEDDSGKTALHACAEFVFEQQKWAALAQDFGRAVPHGQSPRDRFRPLPYSPTDASSGKRKAEEGRGEVDGGANLDDSAYKSVFLENADAAIHAVVDRMIQAGAQLRATAKFPLTPTEYALKCRCVGMMTALSLAEGSASSLTTEMQRQLQLIKPPPMSASASPEMLAELLKHPDRHLSTLQDEDIEWLVRNDADIFRRLEVTHAGPEDYCYGGGKGELVVKPVQSFIDTVALLGLTNFMKHIGQHARYYDSPASVIDKWTLSALRQLSNKSSVGQPTWTLKQLSQRYDIDFRPLIYRACQRPAPNMQMLKVLVEDCGVDVNARAFRRSPMASYFMGYTQTALGYLAARREYWHLAAIRYLVQHGADVNIRDADDETPLFIACDRTRHEYGGSPAWTVPIAKLLLELGADTSIRNTRGQTCRDVAGSPELLELLDAWDKKQKPGPLVILARS